MCDAWESMDAYQRCILVDNLGRLYDKEVRGEADETLAIERRRVTARLLVVTARSESRHACVRPSLRIRES